MDESLIPEGGFCNDGRKVCPYWQHSGDIGICDLLGVSDDDPESFGALWDQRKECKINNSGL